MAITPAKRAAMEKLIYDCYGAMDKSGSNVKKYKEFFGAMTDAQFDKFFKGLFADEKAYIVFDIVDYEHTVTFDDIERAAKVLKVPLFELVYMPHLSMDKTKVVVSSQPVPVGYLNIKRTQQTVSKKKGISTSNEKRSGITGQVTGDDKNGRESDLENTMLVSMGLHETLKELNGPRADDMHMKSEMTRDIAMNGYTTLKDMESLPENKTTLNTIDVFLTGMSINSDLVTKGLMTKKTIKDEL